MRTALDASGAHCVEHLRMGHGQTLAVGKRSGRNLWRTTGDISDKWAGQAKWPDGSCCSNGMLAIVDQQVGLQSYADRTLERSRHAGSGKRRHE